MDLVLHWEIQSRFPKRKNSQGPLSGPMFCWLSCNLSYWNLISSQVVAWKIASPEDYVWQVLNYVQFNSDLLANPVERPSEEYALQEKLARLLHSGTFRTTARSVVASFVGGCAGNWVEFFPPDTKLLRKGPEASFLSSFLPSCHWERAGGLGKTINRAER